VKLAADAIRYGMDPNLIIDRGHEDFLLNISILKRIVKDSTEEKRDEIQALSKLIAVELAQILGKIF
jgi:hypothetical protein